MVPSFTMARLALAVVAELDPPGSVDVDALDVLAIWLYPFRGFSSSSGSPMHRALTSHSKSIWG